MAGWPRRSDRSSGRIGAVPVLALALAVGLALPAGLAPPSARAGEASEAASPETIRLISHRQTELRRMSAAMRVIGRFLKAEGANVADVGAAAEVIRAVSVVFTPAMFPEGSGVGAGRSAARPELWQEWDIFKERATKLQTASARLIAAAATGNAEAVKAPIQDIAQACGSCHELYRRRQP